MLCQLWGPRIINCSLQLELWLMSWWWCSVLVCCRSVSKHRAPCEEWSMLQSGDAALHCCGEWTCGAGAFGLQQMCPHSHFQPQLVPIPAGWWWLLQLLQGVALPTLAVCQGRRRHKRRGQRLQVLLSPNLPRCSEGRFKRQVNQMVLGSPILQGIQESSNGDR